ncbi:SAM-dependent methyltransferase [Leptolyngbya sp. BL0902]|uniref:class I SAM-dependent methyltransferase n=1 Tax=Leptolyngbya sp. BL0902 TaxID=1115757 RepID=UPI0018E8E725|nr:class I SAM-dependent methyltransferase [Leptolyngbya sp. BL0902]QQE63755.1 SAM-dependent methyltransferase [Leptolyngbya sp. BL0902]
MPHHPVLFDVLKDRLRQAPQGQMTFAEFMDLALYDPSGGYYATQVAAIGPQGDFVTSPHLSRDFGELLAVQLAELWHHLSQPEPFTLVEMGAGQGIMAADVLAYLQRQYQDCFAVLDYRIIEKSPVLQHIQSKRLEPWAGRVTWCNWADLAADSVTGCVFSNELVDALPVHQVVWTEAGLQEIYVTWDEASATLKEVIGPLSTPRLADYFDLVGVDWAKGYPVGYRTEAHLAALDWVATVANRLHRGYLLTIDYGYSADRYYSPHRSQGTLQSYYQHTHHNDPYRHLGHQDITAHVNFTALERQGKQSGLTTLGLTQQAMFLMALGLGDRLMDLAQIQSTDPAVVNQAIQRRDQIHQLMNPMGLGNFWVLLQGKNLAPDGAAQPLRGFTIPPLG